MDEDTKDMLAQLSAAAEQAKRAMRDVAQMLGVFRKELLDAGFERDEAIAMCLTHLQAILMHRSDDR